MGKNPLTQGGGEIQGCMAHIMLCTASRRCAGPCCLVEQETDQADVRLKSLRNQQRMAMPELIESHALPANADLAPRRILCCEVARAKPSLKALGIGFSVSYAQRRIKRSKPRKPPYFASSYNVGNLGNINIVAFYHPLIADWDLMDKDDERYRLRVRSGIREEMIHSVQVMTVRDRYERSSDLQNRFETAESYYQNLLGRIIEELADSAEGQAAVLTAAQLYYEDWTITSMEKLRQTDKKLHGRDGYLVSELIRQIVQIRIGELTSEEAKGRAWDKHRIFNVAKFGTTENLLRFMAGTLRQAVPRLVKLSPTLAEALLEIEGAIKKIHQISASVPPN